MPSSRLLVIVPVALALTLAGCTEEAPETASPVSSLAPTAEPSALAPGELDGQVVELAGAGTITVPADALAEDLPPSTSPAHELLYRTADAGEDGFPAVRVVWGEDTVGVYEQTYTLEQAALADPAVEEYTRSPVTWPGSAESVVTTWVQRMETADGDVLMEGVDLTVQTDDRFTVAVVAVAERGHLDDSEVLAALRTLTLD